MIQFLGLKISVKELSPTHSLLIQTSVTSSLNHRIPSTSQLPGLCVFGYVNGMGSRGIQQLTVRALLTAMAQINLVEPEKSLY